MKVHIDGVDFRSTSGPNTMGTRLAKQFIVSGHEIVESGPDADVSLVFIQPSGAPLATKVVQRLDGIWFSPSEFHTKNKAIKSLYDKADSVVWQSEFDRTMTSRFWHKRSGTVIHNGIFLDPVKEITIPSLLKIRQSYELVFVCSANWHRQKRLRKNLELYSHIRETHPHSCVIVLGSNPDVSTPDPHVMYAGSQPQEVYMQVFAVSNWMLHLAWADHCPNVVVESISQGTPVVCSSIGGTKEVVGDFGLVVEDEPYDFELYDYDNPPDIDIGNVTLPARDELGDHANIDIVDTAASYIKEFERILT